MTTRTNRSTGRLVVVASLVCVTAGCGSSSSVAVDGGQVDAPVADAAPTDTGGDAPAPDASPPDAEPLANVFAVSPVDDERKTSQVTLAHLTDPERMMSGKYASVFNCLNKDGGDKIEVTMGGGTFTGKVCKIERTAGPGADGTYLHIAPTQDNDPDDPFAEVNMYHHVTSVHDRFKERLGLTHMDKPLRTLVNVMAYVDLLQSWLGLENAAYVPKETGSFLADFGVDINKGEDALIFTQGDRADPSWDATVIYHEYTHAVIGNALFGTAHDAHGLDPTPGGLNEGLADYFAASFLETPIVGAYTMATMARDVRRTFRCPDHIVGEMHQDGEVVAGTLWAMRELLTPKVADEAIANALTGFTLLTTFDAAATAWLDEVKTLAPDKHDQVKTLFEDRGLLGCVRLMDYETPLTAPAPPEVAPRYAGTAEAPTFFAKGAPSYMQYRVTLAEATEEIEIAYKAQGSGLQGLLPGEPGDLSVALRRGDEPITWDTTSGTATSSADVVLKGTNGTDGVRRLVLAGPCVAGPGALVLQLINHGAEGGELLELSITQRQSASAGATVYDQCASPTP